MDKNSFLITLSESQIEPFNDENFDDKAFPFKVFCAIWRLEAEVNNGGFSQYFFNSSRKTVYVVISALNAIQAPPAGLPPEPDAIRIAAKDFSPQVEEQLNELDREFYRYPHDLTELLFSYVQLHPEEFGPVPEVN